MGLPQRWIEGERPPRVCPHQDRGFPRRDAILGHESEEAPPELDVGLSEAGVERDRLLQSLSPSCQ